MSVIIIIVINIRLCRMPEMQTVATDGCGVCLSRVITWLRCAKTAEQIKILFLVNTFGAKGTLCQTGEGG